MLLLYEKKKHNIRTYRKIQSNEFSFHFIITDKQERRFRLFSMFLAVLAFTLNAFRNYFMFNHQQNPIDDNDDDGEYDEEEEIDTGIDYRMHQLFC